MTAGQTAMSAVTPGKVFLIDGMSHIFRAHYAIRGLTNSQGVPTNAVYGFATMLRKLIRQYQPQYLAVVFDGSQPTFRHEAYQEYKANRTAMPEDLAVQFPYIRRLCEALRVPILELERYEADDIIGTFACRAGEQNLEAVIVSNDKDMFQLVCGNVQVLHQAKEDVLFDAAKVESFFGVTPRQVVDVLGLMGDSVDNVPGAPGIGEKGARDLIKRFGSLNNLLASASEVERKAYRESLQNHREQILQSKELVTIDTKVPIEVRWNELLVQTPDLEKMRVLLTDLGFQSLLKEYESEAPKEKTTLSFASVETPQQLEEAIPKLEKEERIFCYFDFDEDASTQARIRSLAIAGADAGWIGRFQNGTNPGLAGFRGLLEGSRPPKVVHNTKAARVALAQAGITLRGADWDTMLMSYLVQPNRSNHQFAEIAFAQLEKTLGPEPEERCALVRELFQALHPKLQEMHLEQVYRDIELPLAEVLAEMENNGIRIDPALLQGMSGDFEKQIESLTQRAFELAGMDFNINSPKQLGEILFEKLNLPAPKKLKKSGQYSTSVEILEQLAQQYELPRVMLEYRQVAKLKTGYVDALPRLINPKTGRVHTSFNQTVAATGRLSSSNPNLQNIPIRSELGTKIRSAFIPSEGCVLLAADYSQIELRVLAHLSEDPVLLDAFRKGEDIHTRTATEVFGMHPGMQTGEVRRRAKAINFGIVYGQTPFGLAKELEISQKEAQEFIRRYFERYQGVKQFIDATIVETRKTQETRTMFGRLRQIPEIGSRNPALRNFAERTAVNSPIQGTAADLIKLAMIRIHARVAREQLKTKMLLQVHDELVFDVPEGEVEVAQALVQSEMEKVIELRVPLVVSIGTGKNWMEA
jgi:DNA polymerase I